MSIMRVLLLALLSVAACDVSLHEQRRDTMRLVLNNLEYVKTEDNVCFVMSQTYRFSWLPCEMVPEGKLHDMKEWKSFK